MWSNQNDALRIGLDATLTAAKLSKNKAAESRLDPKTLWPRPPCGSSPCGLKQTQPTTDTLSPTETASSHPILEFTTAVDSQPPKGTGNESVRNSPATHFANLESRLLVCGSRQSRFRQRGRRMIRTLFG
jgi:hypothetical protein